MNLRSRVERDELFLLIETAEDMAVKLIREATRLRRDLLAEHGPEELKDLRPLLTAQPGEHSEQLVNLIKSS